MSETTHPIHTLADAIAKAIFATVEKDRCLNLENIREAAFRELAVAEAKTKHEQKPAEKPFNVYRNVEQAGINMLKAIDVHTLYGRVSPSFDRAAEQLRDALQEAGAPV
jgi:hypothetical protein